MKAIKYANIENAQRDEAKQWKDNYRHMLDAQIKEIKDSDVLYGSMTGHEKKMNKRDLHGFKHNKYDQMKALIPGISNY